MGKARWKRLHLDPVLAVCFAALLGFPLAAAIVAAGQPVDPQADARTPAGAGGELRVLPAFSPGSPREERIGAASLLTDARRMRAELTAALRELLGAGRAASVMRLVSGAGGELESLLDAALPGTPNGAQVRRANDAAALLVLAAAAEYGERATPRAAEVAFGLLDRARRGGDCTAQRNLAFLVSTDNTSDPDVVRAEFRRAERLCGGDPTPGWMLGQWESRAAVFDEEREPPALAAFRRLQRRFPASPAGWSGEADLLLRLGYGHEELLAPFTARAHFLRALRLYRRALALGDERGLAAGAARALAGLREFDGAVREQRRALAGRNTLAPVAARYVEYLERGHRFAVAAGAARRLATAHAFAPGRSLIAGGSYGEDEEDTQTPMSLGVDTMRPVQLRIHPGAAGAGSDAGVLDLSFIPQFRDVDGLTGHDRWCPAWSLPRDLLLAGRPRAALAALPSRPLDLTTGGECDVEFAPVEALAALEAGRQDRALARARGALPGNAVHEPIARLATARARALADLREAQQNMWRFAGRLDRAQAAAGAWLRRLAHDPRAADRLGEITFLAKRYDEAARWFGRSIRLSRSRPGGSAAEEAFGLLKRGTALSLAGRRGEALAVLDRADEIATRAVALRRGDSVSAFVSYHARVQTGDTLLRAGRYADAAEAYEAAREREPQLEEENEELLARPEALHNNQSIAESKLGHRAAAIEAAERALAADPQSPVFLETKGHALRAAGRLQDAARAYRAAVRSEPAALTAWNDLGVVLARQERYAEAADAFRRAVGVDSEYAIGWFNLAIAQARRGLRHALSSQGAFGRAFRADDGLSGRRRRFIADDAVLFENLDLSKPLPPRSSHAHAQERTPVAAAGFAVVVLLALRLSRRLIATRFGGDLAGRLIEPLTTLAERFPRVPLYTPWIVAVLATVATFASGVLRPGAGGATEAAVVVAGVLALIVLVVRGRSLAARRAGIAVGQRGWTPGIAVAAAATVAGTAWAPLPVAEPSRPEPAVHWIGPTLTGVAALGLLVLGAWLAIPGTVALAAAALVMTASLLTPAKPLDGGYVAAGGAGVTVALALLAGGLFFFLGVG